jgi:hypothetical protein
MQNQDIYPGYSSIHGYDKRLAIAEQSGEQMFWDKGRCIKYINKSGATLAVGKELIPNVTAGQGLINIFASATWTAGDALALANDLSGEEGIFRLLLTNATNAFTAGNVTITYTDIHGNAMSSTIAVTTDTNGTWSSDFLVLGGHAITVTPGSGINPDTTEKITVQAYAINVFGLPAATADLTTGAGINQGKIDEEYITATPDEGEGIMATAGPIVLAEIYPAASMTPGTRLGTSGNTAGSLGALSTPAPGGAIALLLDVVGANDVAPKKRYVMLRGS